MTSRDTEYFKINTEYIMYTVNYIRIKIYTVSPVIEYKFLIYFKLIMNNNIKILLIIIIRNKT